MRFVALVTYLNHNKKINILEFESLLIDSLTHKTPGNNNLVYLHHNLYSYNPLYKFRFLFWFIFLSAETFSTQNIHAKRKLMSVDVCPCTI